MPTPPFFEDFAAASANKLARTAWLLTGDYHGAEDLVQDTLARVYVKWKRVSRADDPVAYARTTMTNLYISGKRRRSSNERPTDKMPDQPYDANEGQRLDLIRAMQALSTLDRAILVLRFYEDQTPDEVAQELGLSSGAVRNRTMRALRQVRTELDPTNSDAHSAGLPARSGHA